MTSLLARSRETIESRNTKFGSAGAPHCGRKLLWIKSVSQTCAAIQDPSRWQYHALSPFANVYAAVLPSKRPSESALSGAACELAEAPSSKKSNGNGPPSFATPADPSFPFANGRASGAGRAGGAASKSPKSSSSSGMLPFMRRAESGLHHGCSLRVWHVKHTWSAHVSQLVLLASPSPGLAWQGARHTRCRQRA